MFRKQQKQKCFVTKWAPLNITDIRRAEGWLETMAAQGLIYCRQSGWNLLVGGIFNPHFFLAKFRREEPRPGRQYRLVPAPQLTASPSGELLELYRQAGWQYQDSIVVFYLSYFLFFTDDPGALEPYTDPDSFRTAFRYPAWGLALILAAFISLDVALCVLLAMGVWQLEQAALMPHWCVAVEYLLLTTAAGINLVCFALDLTAVLMLKKQIQHHATTRPTLPAKLFPTQKVLTLAGLALSGAVLLIALLSALSARDRTDLPLEEFRPDFDLLTLWEMEGDGSWIPREDWSVEALDVDVHYNTVDVHESPSQEIHTWYHINQAGSGSSGGSTMELDYYLADGPESARAMLERLEQGAAYSDNEGTLSLPDSLPFQAVDVPGAETFLSRQEGKVWEVLALEGDRVLALSYRGSLDLSSWFGEIAEMLAPRAPALPEGVLSWPVRTCVSLAEWEPPFPLLTLGEMEGDDSFVPTEDSPHVLTEMGIQLNQAVLYTDPESGETLQLQINQHGRGSSGISDLDITCYLCQSVQSAQRQLQTLRNSVGQELPLELFPDGSVSGVEEFWVGVPGDLEEGTVPYWTVLARTGNRVVSVTYSGGLDLSQWYDELAAMLTPIS